MKSSLLCLIACGLSLCGCAPTISFKPLVVEPIHVTVDVTIHDESKTDKPDTPAPADAGK